MPKTAGGVYNFTRNYTKFTDCYADQKKVIDASLNKTTAITVTQQAQVTFFEQQLDCSGMCTAPLFWTSKNVTLGPPPIGCVYRIKEVYN